jgi:hypothetical protein
MNSGVIFEGAVADGKTTSNCKLISTNDVFI